jgi:hypothetical protein
MVPMQLLNTCLDIHNETKDNIKEHLAIAKYCDRSKLHVNKYSKGVWKKSKENYCVEKDGKITILK